MTTLGMRAQEVGGRLLTDNNIPENKKCKWGKEKTVLLNLGAGMNEKCCISQYLSWTNSVKPSLLCSNFVCSLFFRRVPLSDYFNNLSAFVWLNNSCPGINLWLSTTGTWNVSERTLQGHLNTYYSSSQMHLPIMFPIFLENRKSIP